MKNSKIQANFLIFKVYLRTETKARNDTVGDGVEGGDANTKVLPFIHSGRYKQCLIGRKPRGDMLHIYYVCDECSSVMTLSQNRRQTRHM